MSGIEENLKEEKNIEEEESEEEEVKKVKKFNEYKVYKVSNPECYAIIQLPNKNYVLTSSDSKVTIFTKKFKKLKEVKIKIKNLKASTQWINFFLYKL